MKIKITLSGSGGELASETLKVRANATSDDYNHQIHAIIEPWILSIGDSITIEQVQS
jgi:hypothetical protein